MATFIARLAIGTSTFIFVQCLVLWFLSVDYSEHVYQWQYTDTQNYLRSFMNLPSLNHASALVSVVVKDDAIYPCIHWNNTEALKDLQYFGSESSRIATMKSGERFVLKLTCRPMINSWRGAQAWAEITASKVSEMIGMDNFPCVYGVRVNWQDNFDDMQLRIPESCKFHDENNTYLMGAAIPYINHLSGEWPSWGLRDYFMPARRKGKTIPTEFRQELRDISDILLMDYVVQNSDRYLDENWFRSTSRNRIIGFDNGLAFWSDLCADFKEALLRCPLLFQKHFGGCEMTKASSNHLDTTAHLEFCLFNNITIHNILITTENAGERLLLLLEEDVLIRWLIDELPKKSLMHNESKMLSLLRPTKICKSKFHIDVNENNVFSTLSRMVARHMVSVLGHVRSCIDNYGAENVFIPYSNKAFN